MTSLADDSRGLSAEFSEEEIRSQLEKLGYRNIPVGLIHEFKQDLDEIVKEDLATVKSRKRIPRAETRAVPTSAERGRERSAGRDQSHRQPVKLPQQSNIEKATVVKRNVSAFSPKTNAQFTLSPTLAAAVTKKQQAGGKEVLKDSAVEVRPSLSAPKEADLLRKTFVVTPKTDKYAAPKCNKENDNDSKVANLQLNVKKLHIGEANGRKKDVVSRTDTRSAGGSCSSRSDTEQRRIPANVQAVASSRLPKSEAISTRCCTRRPATATATCSLATQRNETLTTSVSRTQSLSSARLNSSASRNSVIYTNAPKGKPGANFQKQDPVSKFASYSAAWSTAQSSYAGLFGDGSHRRLRWTVRMMMKRMRDDAAQRERAAQLQRATSRRHSALVQRAETLTGPQNAGQDERRDRQLRWTVRNALAQYQLPLHRSQDDTQRENSDAYEHSYTYSHSDSDPEADSQLQSGENQATATMSDWQPNERYIEDVFQPFLEPKK